MTRSSGLFEEKEKVYLDKEDVYRNSIDNLGRLYKKEKAKKNFFKYFTYVAGPVLFIGGFVLGTVVN